MTSRKCLPELLGGLFRRRMRGDVVMKNSSAAQFHHDEHVQGAEGVGDHDEEVAGDDYLSMIADEGQPTLLRVRCARRSPGTQVLPHSAGRNANAEFQCRFPAPEPLKPFPVPPNEGIGFDIPQSITPGEHLAESRHDPPRGIAGPARLSLSLLKQCQLLPEEQILRCERAPSPATDGDKIMRSGRTNIAVAKQCRRATNRLTCAGMKGSASHVSRHYAVVTHAREKFLRSTGTRSAVYAGCHVPEGPSRVL